MLLLLAHHLEVCASIGSPVTRRTKWPTTYTRYFALWMQLLPEPQSLFSLHLGSSYEKKDKKSIYSTSQKVLEQKTHLDAEILSHLDTSGCLICCALMHARRGTWTHTDTYAHTRTNTDVCKILQLHSMSILCPSCYMFRP